jgi:CsoR family transcriptional regulator, copper-sensing transcriptional repressor
VSLIGSAVAIGNTEGEYRSGGKGNGMHGYTEKKGAVAKRLRRIEGQVRGLERMVEEDAYCIDVLTQISAVNRALQAVALELLDDHLSHCVAEALSQGGGDPEGKVAEASAAIARLVRS